MLYSTVTVTIWKVAVYVARSRVLRKLREEAECVLADSLEPDDAAFESPNRKPA